MRISIFMHLLDQMGAERVAQTSCCDDAALRTSAVLPQRVLTPRTIQQDCVGTPGHLQAGWLSLSVTCPEKKWYPQIRGCKNRKSQETEI